MDFANLHLDSENRHTLSGIKWTDKSEMDWVEDPSISLMALLDEEKLIIDGWENSGEDRFHAQMEFDD